MRLTAHPLQRIGAYASACLAAAERTNDDERSEPDPAGLDADGVAAAVRAMTADAVRAAVVRDTKAADGFFLKSSLSLFPNSPMWHPSNAKRSDEEIAERVRRWRSRPADRLGQDTVCVLCSGPAVGFYGKMDVPLAESDVYRNTTPRGHDGMALCWECLCCFYALPYGSRLTGGPCLALHSWDETFLARTVAAQVAATRQVIEVGAEAQVGLRAREVLALRALRHYEQPLSAGVELLVFSNNNRGPTLDVYTLEQPLAEWLRRTIRSPRLRRGFRTLLRAHRTTTDPGYVGLARSAFRSPPRIPATCGRYLATAVTAPRADEGRAEELAELAVLCFDYADKVMLMDKSDLDEIRDTGRRIAVLLQNETSAGKLREFYARFKDPTRLRSWLQRQGVEWVVTPLEERAGPLLTTHGFGLLFDPDYDNPAWFHRQMLLVAVVEELAVRGWRPEAGEQVDEDLPELDEEDKQFIAEGDREDQR